MLFNSYQFLLFFTAVTAVYFTLPHKYRWLLLLISSCIFYMYFVPVYIVILGATIVVDYFAGRLIEKNQDRRRRLWLILSLCANIGVLAVFKYYNFINENISALLGGFGYKNPIPYLSILLPIGLSFHTFQAMSYTIEVYRGNQRAERNFGLYALYVMFYPQLVAGPIERPQNMLHQFHEEKKFSYDNLVAGLKLVLWGLFKKAVIADRLAILVDTVYNNPEQHNSFSIALATVFFAFQIYCDFSGYCDIALGAARVMGFGLMQNFNFPYAAKNITDYWRRWHISLSTWFNDYLFSEVLIKYRDWGKYAVLFGLMLTFFISGLWHGAGWNFIAWGCLHGIAVSWEYFTKRFRKNLFSRLPSWLGSIIGRGTLYVFLLITWVFFRASGWHQAIFILKRFFGGIASIVNDVVSHKSIFAPYGLEKWELLLSVGLIVFLEGVQYYQRKGKLGSWFSGLPIGARIFAYAGMAVCIVVLGVFSSRQFIYFQF